MLSLRRSASVGLLGLMMVMYGEVAYSLPWSLDVLNTTRSATELMDAAGDLHQKLNDNGDPDVIIVQPQQQPTIIYQQQPTIPQQNPIASWTAAVANDPRTRAIHYWLLKTKQKNGWIRLDALRSGSVDSRVNRNALAQMANSSLNKKGHTRLSTVSGDDITYHSAWIDNMNLDWQSYQRMLDSLSDQASVTLPR